VKSIAFIFLLLVAFFTVQPLISSQRTAEATTCCSGTKCHQKSQPSNDSRKCRKEGCNPFMACAYGNFYLLEKNGFTFFDVVPEKEKKVAINDNRLSTGLSESWHPPEWPLPVS
jgi:hypothetical protein